MPIIEHRCLGWLVSSLLVQAIAVVFLVVKRGVKYLPTVEDNKTPQETFKFMSNYLRNGTTVAIVSNRISMLQQSRELFDELNAHAKAGKQVEIITPKPVPDAVRLPLEAVGVRFIVTNENVPPEARFTLLNADRAGAERLAIARGTHPEHEITVFDSDSGPHVIAMAKDIVRKSKLLAHAASMG